jgi:predicted dehydrogenase/D-arabinose 1-dehydrogenase-like Zn-dependent alcohol dehydrogenase
MLVEFGQANLLAKARAQPEKVRQVLGKIRTDGLLPTLEAVFARLDEPLPLGYCNAGVVLEVGESVTGFQRDARVVSIGSHAEIVCVPQNLCAQVPDQVSDEEAAFTVIGAIALQGVRLTQPNLGECFAVTGLGLIGLITVQILQAQGCRVLGIDLDPERTELARRFGAETVNLSAGEDLLAVARAFSRGRGVDGVLLTLSSKSNEPISQAAHMCRKRGRVVLVGVTGLELNRADFYEKELTFQVSCSYGPGRYDPIYEEKGQDYPIGFVRWTEQRNFEAILDLMAQGKLNVKPLISEQVPFSSAPKVYKELAASDSIGTLLVYSTDAVAREPIVQVAKLPWPESPKTLKKAAVAAIGAGNFARLIQFPALKTSGARLVCAADQDPKAAAHAARKYGFEKSATDPKIIMKDPGVNTVFITTRHNSHAHFVLEALKSGKHVFVEKPLCLTLEELNEITEVYSSIANCKSSIPMLMVGFNRRFATQIRKMKELLDGVKEPKSCIMTVNAGFIPPEHWTHDLEVGGGRIVGEACHFVDLLRFLSEVPIESSEIFGLDNPARDTVSIQLRFTDGSIGTIHYFTNGSRRFPKERLEVFVGQKILQLHNFKVLKGYGWKNFRKMKLWRQDKGHRAEVKAFLEAVQKGGPSPIPFDEIVEVTRTTIELANKR